MLCASSFLALQAQTPSATAASSGVYTAAQAQQGNAAYQKQCASCHGDDLGGSGQTPPLNGDEFMTNWQGQTMGDLFEKVQTSMPADHPGTLTREQTADLLAYLLSSNHFPAGKTDLPTDAAALKQIHIDKAPAGGSAAGAADPGK